ncbi:MAG: tetraacyldisaccharide 4'-kinase [Candidatus Rokubacteria bacterium]|nr:tetraacyldisaccharide 4'-kinase [Candidatus Rokubacteria bacterium]
MRGRRHEPERLLRRVWDTGAPRSLAAGLGGLAWGYRAVLALREQAYARGALRAGRLGCPVISVGNVTLGGAGKTPTVELAVRTLEALGARPAVLSRGYGRRTRGTLMVADGARILLGPEAAGDEPYMLARRLPGTVVVVGESRYQAGRIAVEAAGATVLVIDDGFQHRSLAKDLDILVVRGQHPWGNGRLFPRGVLREPLTALARAQLVVVTNPREPADLDRVARTLCDHRAPAPVVGAAYRVERVWEAGTGRSWDPSELRGRRLLAFAGVGSPRGFAETVAALGVVATGLAEFPDHHWYEAADLERLAALARASGGEGLITTEKDWVRLEGRVRPALPLLVLAVGLALEANASAWHEALTAAWVGARSRACP